MKNSYIVKAWGGQIVFPQEVLDQLNLPASTVLYAVPCYRNGSVQDLVVSPLPPSSWERTYRLDIYVAEQIGSLAAITKVLGDQKLNLLSAWSAATSATGEGCFTAVVEMLAQPTTTEELTKRLEAALKREFLSSSPLFKEPGGLSLVYLVKLAILAQVFEEYVRDREDQTFTLALKHRVSNLHKLERPDPDEAFDFLEKAAGANGRADYVILTPDSEERYMIISALASREYRKLVVPLKVSGKPEHLLGFFAEVLDSLAKQRINVIYAHNSLLAKRSLQQTTVGESEEDAEFAFTIDTSSSNLPTKAVTARKRLADRITDAIGRYSKEKGVTLSLYESQIRLLPLDYSLR